MGLWTIPRMPKPTARKRPASPGAERSAELIARALAHIDARLDQALDADTLADCAAMSRFHFHRVFRAHVGCTVAAYVQWRRLQRACALLVSGRESVLDVALAVGYDSAQSLAKAMRRELDTTPTAVRRGDTAPWKSRLHAPRSTPSAFSPGGTTMNVTRIAQLPPGMAALTATARGMVNHSLDRAARQAFDELLPAVGRAGLLDQVASVITMLPDSPHGPDDAHCRFVAGVLFGYSMLLDQGECKRPPFEMSGTLAWQTLAGGRYAVFTHMGPYTTLHQTWDAIYRDWLPASREALRDAPPLELSVNSPCDTRPEKLHTEIWLPLI